MSNKQATFKTSKGNLKDFKKMILGLMEYDYEFFVKALISIENDINDEKLLTKIFNEYMKADEPLLNEIFNNLNNDNTLRR